MITLEELTQKVNLMDTRLIRVETIATQVEENLKTIANMRRFVIFVTPFLILVGILVNFWALR